MWAPDMMPGSMENLELWTETYPKGRRPSCGARSSEVQFIQTSAPVTQIRSTPPSCSAGTHFGGFRKIFGM